MSQHKQRAPGAKLGPHLKKVKLLCVSCEQLDAIYYELLPRSQYLVLNFMVNNFANIKPFKSTVGKFFHIRHILRISRHGIITYFEHFRTIWTKLPSATVLNFKIGFENFLLQTSQFFQARDRKVAGMLGESHN